MLLFWYIANCIRTLIYWHVAVLMCWYINMLLYWYIDLRWHRDPAPMLHRHIDVLMYASNFFRCFVDMIQHWAICVMTVTASPYYITSVFIMTWWLTMTHIIWTLLVRTMWSTPRTNQVCAYKCADDKRKSAVRKKRVMRRLVKKYAQVLLFLESPMLRFCVARARLKQLFCCNRCT